MRSVISRPLPYARCFFRDPFEIWGSSQETSRGRVCQVFFLFDCMFFCCLISRFGYIILSLEWGWMESADSESRVLRVFWKNCVGFWESVGQTRCWKRNGRWNCMKGIDEGMMMISLVCQNFRKLPDTVGFVHPLLPFKHGFYWTTKFDVQTAENRRTVAITCNFSWLFSNNLNSPEFFLKKMPRNLHV